MEVYLLYYYIFIIIVFRNSEGCTPFMQAVCCHAYNAALIIMDAACTIATHTPADSSEPQVDRDQLMSMLYPRGSTLDNSPLHVLCCNDTCSFTWTGAEHINQVFISWISRSKYDPIFNLLPKKHAVE